MPKKAKDDQIETPVETTAAEPVTDQANQVAELQAQVAQLQDSWKRALADYQNLLRRVEDEKKNYVRLANANLIARLLPSLDIMDLAALHTKDLGVEMAAKQFRQALTEDGLIEISPSVGDPFDHTTSECTEVVPLAEGAAENTVSELVLKGYRLGDYVLRPARVKVYKSAN